MVKTLIIFFFLYSSCSSNDLTGEDVKKAYQNFLANIQELSPKGVHFSILFLKDLRENFNQHFPSGKNMLPKQKDAVLYRIIHDGWGIGFSDQEKATPQDIEIIKNIFTIPFSLGEKDTDPFDYFFGPSFTEDLEQKFFQREVASESPPKAIQAHRTALYHILKTHVPRDEERFGYLNDPYKFIEDVCTSLEATHPDETLKKTVLQGLAMYTLPYLAFFKDYGEMTYGELYDFTQGLFKQKQREDGLFLAHSAILADTIEKKVLQSFLQDTRLHSAMKTLMDAKTSWFDLKHIHFLPEDLESLTNTAWKDAKQLEIDSESLFFSVIQRRFIHGFNNAIKGYITAKNKNALNIYFETGFVAGHCYPYQHTQMETCLRYFDSSPEDIASSLVVNTEPTLVIRTLLHWAVKADPSLWTNEEEMVQRITDYLQGAFAKDFLQKYDFNKGRKFFTDEGPGAGGMRISWDPEEKKLLVRLQCRGEGKKILYQTDKAEEWVFIANPSSFTGLEARQILEKAVRAVIKHDKIFSKIDEAPIQGTQLKEEDVRRIITATSQPTLPQIIQKLRDANGGKPPPHNLITLASEILGAPKKQK